MSNTATMPTTPKPQTSKEVIADNVKLLDRAVGSRTQRRAYRLPHRHGPIP